MFLLQLPGQEAKPAFEEGVNLFINGATSIRQYQEPFPAICDMPNDVLIFKHRHQPSAGRVTKGRSSHKT